MERSSAAVGAVRRLRTQQQQQQQQQGQPEEKRKEEEAEEEEEEEGREWRRRRKAGGNRLPPPPPLLPLPESRAAPLLLLYLLALRGLVQVSFQQLVRTAPQRLPREFSAPRARAYLENITAIGPRTVGSPENEIFTVNYLLEQVKVIERESSHVHRISVDVQRPTGTFSIDFLGGFTSYYDNITNVVVKLEPRSGAEHAVLSNCHFDSVPNTLGPENPWLVQAYISAAKHPFGCVVAQEVFQSGIIPAETDFRIYRDFGNVPGIDLAFIENGYIYHTKYDTADRILTDSIQRAGDNILGVLKYLATSDKLARSHEYRHGNVVFFDVFGMFVLAYPARVGAIMNYVITALAVLYLGKKMLQPRKRAVSYAKELAIACVLTVLSWLAILLGVLIVAVFISLIGRSLSWYTHFYVSVFLYGTAALAKLIFIHTLAKTFYYKHTNEQFLAEIFFDVPVVFWSISLALFTYLGVSSAFVSAIWVAFPLLTKLMTYKELNEKGATMKFITVYLLGMFIPHLYLLYLNWIIFEMFVPIMGRSGSEIPPDIIVAAFIVLICILLSSYLLKFIYLAKSTKRTIITLTTVSAITFTLVCSGIFFPYSSDAANPRPKRVFLQLTFEVSGPSHMSLYFRPHQGSTLSRWSLGDGTPVANAVGGDYFVFYSHGLQALPWHFWIELKASEEPTKGMVTLAIVTHYFFGEDQKSPQLHALIERFPNWTFPSGWVSTYDQFIF
ncbi:hypothetical protein JD844_009273 [Phrynosoma platyrhinos]|uniref:Endoplasmic reticulum metallopeptidase 1 n=1 Tax=Phrynosoma platyrhinos TaxID=52577 RepID=A0ABQ7TFI8_PHRPL|nr:hypothetical protein JD844_009273 [Phrynosoma platyrhinos]